MAIVFVISKDWILRAGLRAQLREIGIEALGFETVGEAANALADARVPSVIVVEGGDYPAAAQWRAKLGRSAQLLVVASGTDLVQSLPAGDTLVRRPVRIGDLAAKIQNILKGIPA